MAANPPKPFPLHNWARAALPIRSSAQALTSVYKSSANNKEYSRKILSFSHLLSASKLILGDTEAEAQAARKHRQFLRDYSWAIVRGFA